jgi:hypothetical protein
MVLLQPDVKLRLATSNGSKLEDDLDGLDLMVKYAIFDREASIREAKEPNQHGKGGSDVE